MKKRLIICFLFLGLLNISLKGQDILSGEKIVAEEESVSTPFFSAIVGWTFPQGDMLKSYKSFMHLGANLGWKTYSNWVWMVEFGFGFGSDNAKEKDEILSNMMTSPNDGFVISSEGSDAGVVAFNRNLSIGVKVGKLFTLSSKRPNSGILFQVGGGFLQHQIIYQSTLEIAKQLEGDYAYLYDRQKRGFSLSVFLGYMHLGRENFTNFYAGIEINQAWTFLTREYQINYNDSYNRVFNDRTITIKAGWLFPFYGRKADKEYYY
ncbi:MAG: hypothetical protein LBM25_04850 [Bacteroidales bacterium]|jgi:hypothetical protein|nr:hypothetical protein [Bacteroidales bacterium]